MWKPSIPDRYKEVLQAVDVWAQKMNASVERLQFDDENAMTVDVYVDRSGVTFKVVHKQTIVDAIKM